MSVDDILFSALRKVVKKFEFQNYYLKYNSLDETIENYFGVLIPITLIGESNDGKLQRDLIVKVPPNKKELRDTGIIDILYGAEIFFYSILIPFYQTLSKFDISELIPVCYYTDSTQYKEVLVLKDMCGEGFKRHQGERFLDPDHIATSLRSLAQLHSLSMLLQNNHKNIDHINTMRPYCSTYPGELMITLKNSLKNNLYIFNDTKHENFFSLLLNNFDDIVNDNTTKPKHLVYGHGDFWKENILFKYEDNKLTKACILDYQTTRLLSPAQDVLSFILTSTETTIRREYYEYFLSTYYDCLHQTISDHCLLPDRIYSRRDFDEDLQIVALYCFITTNMSFSLWLGLEEKALVKSKNLKNEKKQKEAAILSYKRNMLDIVDDFITFGCKDYYKEVIAIQDMCDEGYKPFIRSMFLDVDHLTVSLKSLAKFHSLSFMLEYKDVDVFEEIKNACIPLKTNKRFLDILLDRLEKALKNLQNTCYVPLLQNLKQNCCLFIQAAYTSSQRNCLCHGDMWKENIFFKYKDNKPVSACLIDIRQQ